MTITQQPFGQTAEGVPVALYTLTNAGGMRVTITNYGGKIVGLWTPDRNGTFADIVLGFDTLDGYLAPNPFFGTLVGRCANRIRDARFVLNGVTYHLTPNEGRNHLHGGVRGFDKVLWDATPTATGADPALNLKYVSHDGEEGYPGTLAASVTYTLTGDNALHVDYRAVPEADTIVNLTNHSYFNLRGAGMGTVMDHELRLDADAFTPTDAAQTTTGEIRAVTGTPMDFRHLTRIGERSDTEDQQLAYGGGYDHNWVLAGDPVRRGAAIAVYEPISGRLLEIETTAPGVQFYAGNKLDGRPVVGKGGARYAKHAGLCLETQHFPDAINHPHFPSPIVRAGEHYRQHTVYRFSTRP